VVGATGASGVTGATGATGASPTGATGATGARGPTAPTKTGIAASGIYAWAQLDTDLTLTSNGQIIHFTPGDTEPPNPSGISFVNYMGAGANTGLQLSVTGTYLVNFGFSGYSTALTSSSSIALQLSGTTLASVGFPGITEAGIVCGTSVLVSVGTADSVLALQYVNTSGSFNDSLSNTEVAITAFMTVFLIHPWRTYPNKIFRRISGLFWPIFVFILGGSYTGADITPQNKNKNRLKRTRNSTETFY
jgi:hypothetical protein